MMKILMPLLVTFALLWNPATARPAEECAAPFADTSKMMEQVGVVIEKMTSEEVQHVIDAGGQPPSAAGFEYDMYLLKDEGKTRAQIWVVVEGCVVGTTSVNSYDRYMKLIGRTES